MAHVYHKADGEILAVTEQNILTFPPEDNIKVTAYPNLPANVDYTFYKMDDKGVITENVEKLKLFKLDEISAAFEHELGDRIFMCSQQFEVDNRRSGTKNDKENVQSLIDLALSKMEPYKINGVIPEEVMSSVTVPFRGVSEERDLTVSQLQTLKLEMIEDGFSVYQKKWQLEAQVTSCTTNSQVLQIKW